MGEKFQCIIALSFKFIRNAEYQTCQKTTFPSLIDSATPLVQVNTSPTLIQKKGEAINIYLQHTQRVLNLNKTLTSPISHQKPHKSAISKAFRKNILFRDGCFIKKMYLCNEYTH